MSDEQLLEDARAVIRPLAPREPRTGFAARVALNARDGRRSGFGAWLRWAFGGLALAGVAALAVAVVAPPGRSRHDEVALAQNLELFEDLSVVQNQQALEDLDVVRELHRLEARP